MKALVGAFNQEKALVGAFSVFVQLHQLIVYNTTEGRGCAAAGARAGGEGRRGRAAAAQPPARQPRLGPPGPRHRGCQRRAGAKQESAHRGGEHGALKSINRCTKMSFLSAKQTCRS